MRYEIFDERKFAEDYINKQYNYIPPNEDRKKFFESARQKVRMKVEGNTVITSTRFDDELLELEYGATYKPEKKKRKTGDK